MVDLVTVLKKEPKSVQMTYADLARGPGLAESSVKRMLARGDMPLSRIDAICRVLRIDFAELARRVADAQPLLKEMSREQEKAVVADKILERMQRVAQDFVQQHQADQQLAEKECWSYTLLLAMRSWEFAAFTTLRRAPGDGKR